MSETNSLIRLADPSDEPEILHLMHVMHAESGWNSMDVERCRDFIARAVSKQDGHLAVIGVPGSIRAMLYLLITSAWYTRDLHLEELFCWVHPEHRKSDYAKLLIDHAKRKSDDLSQAFGKKVPLVMGVLTNQRTEAKVRLYRRFFGFPAGAFFLHNARWEASRSDPAREDFWRIPSVAKFIHRRTSKDSRKLQVVG